MSVWFIFFVVTIAYCVGRSILDFQAKRFVWASLGLISTVTLLMTPIPTHGVVIELPVNR